MSEVQLRCHIMDLDLAAGIGFGSQAAALRARSLVEGRVSGARLPTAAWSIAPLTEDVKVHLDLADETSMSVLARYTGLIDSPRYAVDTAGFHWDYTRVVTALMSDVLLGRGVIPVHSAVLCVNKNVVLLPGASGAGKSSLSFTAIDRGHVVLASELAFVHDSTLQAANSTMTIDEGALRVFDLAPPPGSSLRENRVTLPTEGTPTSAQLSHLVFPRVFDGPLQIRPISDRRARMLLFQNVINELPLSQLIAHESFPLAMPLTRDQYLTIAHEVAMLSQLHPAIIEGRPRDILGALSRL